MDHTTIRLIIGLLLVVAVIAIAGKRAWTLFKLITSGQATVDRPESRPAALETQATEVLGQKKLLQWSVPGIAHVFAMWGFIILTLTIIETLGAVFIAQDFAIPFIGRWAVIGFIEDVFILLVLVGLVIFAIIRLRTQPAKQGRILPVLRLPHRCRLAGPVHDLQRHLDAVGLPSRAVQRGRVHPGRG